LQSVQLSIADGKYAAAVREAAARSCAWHIESVEQPDLSRKGVLVLDEAAFERLTLPLPYPERVVLIIRKEPELLAEAWEAGIVSVVSEDDPMSTVLLAIMAAGLRAMKSHNASAPSEISPTVRSKCGSLAPRTRNASPGKSQKVH
jgi:hypothetical protein